MWQLGRRSAEIFQDAAEATVLPAGFVPDPSLDLTTEYSAPTEFLPTNLTLRDRGGKKVIVVEDEDNIARARFEAQVGFLCDCIHAWLMGTAFHCLRWCIV